MGGSRFGGGGGCVNPSPFLGRHGVNPPTFFRWALLSPNIGGGGGGGGGERAFGPPSAKHSEVGRNFPKTSELTILLGYVEWVECGEFWDHSVVQKMTKMSTF